ncbi:MAG: enoyl-CoA hydratase/isomerase family protein [Halobacteriales archaeon]
MTPESFVEVEHDGAVAVLTVDRAERHNSLVPALLDQLDAAAHAAFDRDGCRAVVLETAGASFSTGGDVRAIYDHRHDGGAYADRLVGALNDVIRTFLRAPVPIVVAVDGQVNGGSVGLVLCGDVVHFDPAATITPYYATVGFSPDGGWTALMPERIGRRRTAEVLATDRTVHPEEAVAWGLGSAVVTDPGARARSTAVDVAEGVPGALANAMALLRPDVDAVGEGLERERRRFVEQVQTEEALAGMATFLAE